MVKISTLLALASLALAIPLFAQEDLLQSRYGYGYNAVRYPQQSPEEALKSVVMTFHKEQLGYLLAHLADPAYVDFRIEQYKRDYPRGSDEGKQVLAFNRLLKETEEHFLKNPELFKELRLFAEKAKWDTADDLAVGTVEELSGRRVYMRRFLGRWFLQNNRAGK